VEAARRKLARLKAKLRSPALAPSQAVSGSTKTIETYSWTDGRHKDYPDAKVSLYLTIDDPADEMSEISNRAMKELVQVTFTSSSLKVEARLPRSERTYIFKRDSLYDEIDPESSSWYVSKGNRRLVIKLAKVDAKKKWPGLTKVFAIVNQPNDSALDYGIAAMTGSTKHLNQSKPKGDQHIVSGKREYWEGPPKYTWDKYDKPHRT
jgi:hypothetical protein